jgi:hypothetical protein
MTTDQLSGLFTENCELTTENWHYPPLFRETVMELPSHSCNILARLW